MGCGGSPSRTDVIGVWAAIANRSFNESLRIDRRCSCSGPRNLGPGNAAVPGDLSRPGSLASFPAPMRAVLLVRVTFRTPLCHGKLRLQSASRIHRIFESCRPSLFEHPIRIPGKMCPRSRSSALSLAVTHPFVKLLHRRFLLLSGETDSPRHVLHVLQQCTCVRR